jgi:hypothetical protein
VIIGELLRHLYLLWCRDESFDVDGVCAPVATFIALLGAGSNE